MAGKECTLRINFCLISHTQTELMYTGNLYLLYSYTDIGK